MAFQAKPKTAPDKISHISTPQNATLDPHLSLDGAGPNKAPLMTTNLFAFLEAWNQAPGPPSTRPFFGGGIMLSKLGAIGASICQSGQRSSSERWQLQLSNVWKWRGPFPIPRRKMASPSRPPQLQKATVEGVVEHLFRWGFRDYRLHRWRCITFQFTVENLLPSKMTWEVGGSNVEKGGETPSGWSFETGDWPWFALGFLCSKKCVRAEPTQVHFYRRLGRKNVWNCWNRVCPHMGLFQLVLGSGGWLSSAYCSWFMANELLFLEPVLNSTWRRAVGKCGFVNTTARGAWVMVIFKGGESESKGAPICSELDVWL